MFFYATVEPHVTVNHAGTVICSKPIEFGPNGYIEFNKENEDDSPNFTGEYMTLEDFVKSTDNYKSVSSLKKSNMAYWDTIDNLAEEYVKNLSKQGFMGIPLDDNALLEIGKEITEKAIVILETQYGYEFPYVNDNY